MPRPIVFVNASQIATCAGPAAPRRGFAMSEAAVVTRTAVAVRGDTIVATGPEDEIRRRYAEADEYDCGGRLLTPGLVDSHTHAVFGQGRFAEQELRSAGADYMEIARRGGGIHSSVRDLRERSDDELYALAAARLARLASYGTTTVEVKSGYGLSVIDELRILRIIQRLSDELPIRIVATWLGAHEIPLEYRDLENGRGEYIELLLHELLPLVERERLAVFADVFCEPGVFTIDESRAILTAARQRGLALKLHADELKSSGGAELAVELGATSADHLAAISDTAIRSLAASDTVATLLPGTMLFLGRKQQAPARALLDAGAAVALATDFNPGTSPTCNFPLILTLGVSQLRLSASEALIGATVNGAAALGLAAGTGQLAPGFSADLVLWDADDFREIPYWYGDRRCIASWVRGKPCHPS